MGGNYAVSDRGRVKRLTPGRRTKPGQMLSLSLMKIGYHMVNPVVDGKNVPMYVHRLVAEAFVGPCPAGLEVNHKDGDKTNNVVTNLEYVTHGENMRHARRLGLIHDRCTIPDTVVRRVRKLRQGGMSYSKIVKATGVSIGHCWSIANNQKRRDA
jgi:hypothetical protein